MSYNNFNNLNYNSHANNFEMAIRFNGRRYYGVLQPQSLSPEPSQISYQRDLSIDYPSPTQHNFQPFFSPTPQASGEEDIEDNDQNVQGYAQDSDSDQEDNQPNVQNVHGSESSDSESSEESESEDDGTHFEILELTHGKIYDVPSVKILGRTKKYGDMQPGWRTNRAIEVQMLPIATTNTHRTNLEMIRREKHKAFRIKLVKTYLDTQRKLVDRLVKKEREAEKKRREEEIANNIANRDEILAGRARGRTGPALVELSDDEEEESGEESGEESEEESD